MSPDQVVMLFLMALIGMAGMPMIFEGKGIVLKIGYAWMAFWWLPLLALVWVKGVFG